MNDFSEDIAMRNDLKKLRRIAAGKAKTPKWFGTWKLEWWQSGRLKETHCLNSTFGACRKEKNKLIKAGTHKNGQFKIVHDQPAKNN